MRHGTRKQIGGEIKARAVLETLRGERTANEIASKYEVHPTLITKWKKQVVDGMPEIFSRKRDEDAKRLEEERGQLYQKIGRLEMELDWLKKKSGLMGL